MRLLLFCFLISFYVHLHAQTDQELSAGGQSYLEKIYEEKLFLPPTGFSEFEEAYLGAYQNFMLYQQSESQLAYRRFLHFMKKYEEANNNSSIQNCFFATLCIQKGLLQFNEEDLLDATFSFYKGIRTFNKIDTTTSSPDYLKLKGLTEILLSQVRQRSKLIGSVFNLEGDQTKGFELLKKHLIHAKEKKGYYQEALLLYSYCLLKFGNPSESEVFDLMEQAQKQKSPIISFVVLSLATKNQLGNEAIRFAQTIPQNQYESFPLLHYAKGRALLNRLDPKCQSSFEQFYNTYEGNSFKADSWLRLGWLGRINKDEKLTQKAMETIDNCHQLPTSNDKQAPREKEYIHSTTLPLLMARLLFDGGFFTQAKDTLLKVNTDSLDQKNKAEYHYRLGRIYQKLTLDKDALTQFDLTIELCQNDHRYIGPYAALEAAKISLRANRKEAVGHYLDIAYDLNNGEYKSDINREIKRLDKGK